jgi:lipopolysaccharide/colanic/teichoic acid biosynthesis glycosyltransferase
MNRLSRVPAARSLLLLAMLEAVLLFLCYLAASRWASNLPELGWDELLPIGVAVAALLVALYFQNLYEDLRPQSRVQLLQRFSRALGVVFLLEALLVYAGSSVPLHRDVMLYGSALVLLAVPAFRTMYCSFARKLQPVKRLLFVGRPATLERIAARFSERPDLGLAVAGYLDSVEGSPSTVSYLGPPERLTTLMRENPPDRIVYAPLERLRRSSLSRLVDQRIAAVPLESVTDLYESTFNRVAVAELAPAQLIFSHLLEPRANSLALQRVCCLVLAAIGILVTSPLLLVVFTYLKLSRPGPILSTEEYVGRNGLPFKIRKIPLTRRGGDRWVEGLKPDNLLLLWNVLRGDMSLVGPRAERPEFVAVLEGLIPFYRQRLLVRPGITGWAQINQDGAPFEDTVFKLECDLYYVKDLSPTFDLRILLRTVIPW